MKRNFIIFLIVFFLKNAYASAKAPLNISSKTLFLDNEDNIQVNFDNSLWDCQSKENCTKYRIRPLVKGCTSLILTNNDQVWVSARDLWSNMPYLNPSFKIKVPKCRKFIATLEFEVQRVHTGEIFKSNKISFWTKTKFINNYINALNQNLQST